MVVVLVLKAVVAFNIASMFESDPKLAKENIVKGIALLVIASNIECFHIGLNWLRYFFLNKTGMKINEAIINLACTSGTAPNSGAATLIKINALPHTAPSKVNNAQYLNSII